MLRYIRKNVYIELTEGHGEMNPNEISGEVIGAAVAVHRVLGPGLLEQPYKLCLAHELRKRKLRIDSELALPVVYDEVTIDLGYRIDLLVENTIVIETKSVIALTPLHRAQLITYLRLGDFPIGLLLNFNELRLKDGIVRLINAPNLSLSSPSDPLRGPP